MNCRRHVGEGCSSGNQIRGDIISQYHGIQLMERSQLPYLKRFVKKPPVRRSLEYETNGHACAWPTCHNGVFQRCCVTVRASMFC